MHNEDFYFICSQTALLDAAQKNYHGIAVTLLNRGASVQLADWEGMSM